MTGEEELGDVIEDETTFRDDESPDHSIEAETSADNNPDDSISDDDDPVCTIYMILFKALIIKKNYLGG